jgi:hypothetical protein
VSASAECGCRVELGDDSLEVFPCANEQHARALAAAARDLAERTGIEIIEAPE